MFKFGSKSKQKLIGLHPLGIKTVERALQLSDVDFSVIETVRTIEKQKQNIEVGWSWTMDSFHIPRIVEGEVEEVALAVDLYPWVNGKTSHAPEHYNRLAKAMFLASMETGIISEWGGFWKGKQNDKPHWQFIGINRINSTIMF